MKECLECHFIVGDKTRYCPKCDADLRQQSDGSTLTVDVAHSGQTKEEALEQLRSALFNSARAHNQFLRVIVGTGLISEAVYTRLVHLKRSGRIKSFDYEGSNRGSIMVRGR